MKKGSNSIPRRLRGIDAFEAVRLWWRYQNDYDRDALAVLLEYNREDVVNLEALRERLDDRPLPS